MSLKKTAFFIGMAALFLCGTAKADLKTKQVEYKDGDTVLKGYLAYDDSFKGQRPGVLVVHEWWGLNDFAKGRAEQLAKLGYVAFAADMYGKGMVAKDYKEAGKLSGALKADREVLRKRALAGLAVLEKQPDVDVKKVAAIGYCFGGGVALELARAGTDLAGVVSFHGNLDTPHPDDDKIQAKVLVLQGAEDAYTLKDVPALEEELNKAGADWQLTEYSGAVHGFTNPANGNDPSKGVAYNENADKRSWAAMRYFFGEIFKSK